MILGFADSRPQALALAHELDCPHAEIAVHRFPDGESRVTLPAGNAEHVVLLRSLDRPNDKLVELVLAVKALRQRRPPQQRGSASADFGRSRAATRLNPASTRCDTMARNAGEWPVCGGSGR